MKALNGTGFELLLQRGPFQNNGATPWYCELSIGTPSQTLKMCFDTGSNFNWVTSSLCTENSCTHYADGQFNLSASSTLKRISTESQPVSFGPWGTMQVELGKDKLSLSKITPCNALFMDMFLAKEYSGLQFEELDWDGGIGLPSSQNSLNTSVLSETPFRLHQSNAEQYAEFHFFLQLIQKKLVSNKKPYITFLTPSADDTSLGRIEFGRLDHSYASSLEYLFLPWSCYQEEASYLWGTSGASIRVGGQIISADMFFSLDSGSSQFKGDESVLSQIYNLTTPDNPLISITLLDDTGLEYGELEISSDIYKCKIEAGEKKGQVISQFQALSGADNMLLVGSVLMDHLYTVYEYDVVSENKIQPKGVWIFNKHTGPQIIKTKQTAPALLFRN